MENISCEKNFMWSTHNMSAILSFLHNFALPTISTKYLVIGLMHLSIFLVDLWWPKQEGESESPIPFLINLLGNQTFERRSNVTLKEAIIREIIKEL